MRGRALVPIVVYWVYSGMYMLLGQSMDKYRLHTRREEDIKNLVSKRDVVKGVLLQQLVQAAVAAIVFTLTSESTKTAAAIAPWQQTSYLTVARQFAVAMAVLDGWQYAWHRYMHLNRFLYRHIHSWHHRLVVPYAFDSQYNHPVEGLLLDAIGGALAFIASGMSPRASIFFFSLCTVKGIDDHCGLWLPGNVFHLCFWNNTAYHDVHHQLRGSRFNFSQPFFVTWDKLFGRHMPYVLEERPEGGLHQGRRRLFSVGDRYCARVIPREVAHYRLHASSLLIQQFTLAFRDRVKNSIPMYDGNEHLLGNMRPVVLDAYARQFRDDFMMFLGSRAKEMLPGGRMVLSFTGTRSPDPATEPTQTWELIGRVLDDMASRGIIDKEKLKSFYIPIYAPSEREVKEIIEQEGSFPISKLQVHDSMSGVDKGLITPKMIAHGLRAGFESIIVQHFGSSAKLMDEFVRTAEDYMNIANLQDELAKNPRVFLAMSLAKRS